MHACVLCALYRAVPQEVMRQPALLLSSNLSSAPSYEREAIEGWLSTQSRDPKSNTVLASYQLVPNEDLARCGTTYWSPCRA